MSTIDYYNNFAQEFFERTVNLNMMPTYDRFLRFVESCSCICDLGCGSGRDTKYFKKKGYSVTAIDGAREMCKLAERYTGQEVICMNFFDIDKNIDFLEKFDSIWACSSLLHVPYKDMKKVYEKIIRCCKNNAVIYTSYKCGQKETIKDGRIFSNFTQEVLYNFIESIPQLILLDQWISFDVRGRTDNSQLVNVILKVCK